MMFAMAIESQFATNLTSMFWGSDLIVGLMAMGFFIALIALTKIPVQIMAPLYAMAMIIVAIMIPTFAFVFAIVIGIILAAFLYSFLEK